MSPKANKSFERLRSMSSVDELKAGVDPRSAGRKNERFLVNSVRLTRGRKTVELRSRGDNDLMDTVREVFIGGYYTPRELPVRIRKNDVVFDVGANIGTFSVLASLYSPAMIYAFEPLRQNIAALKENALLNHVKNLVAVEKAVSTVSGRSDFIVFGQEKNRSRLPLPKLDAGRRPGRETVAVKTVSVEDFMRAAKVPGLDFLKLDCEGEEYGIILGMDKELLKSVRCLSLEYHDCFNKGSSAELARYLKSLGFSVCFNMRLLSSDFGYLYAWRNTPCGRTA